MSSPGLIYDIYLIFVLLAWSFFRVGNIVQRWTRYLLLGIAALMLLWMMLRIIKWYYVEDATLIRYLWYAYYFPICLMPALSVVCAVSINKPMAWHPTWQHVALLVVGVLLSFGVFSNDAHQLMFCFSDSVFWNRHGYAYGPLRYIVLAFIIACAIGTIVIIIRRSHVPYSRNWLVALLIPLVMGIIYGILYQLREYLDMTGFYCLLVMFEYECLMSAGLIRTNSNYQELFEASSLQAALLDEQGQVLVASKNAPTTWEQGTSTGKSVHSIPVSGGSFCWVEDNSLEYQARHQLEEQNTELMEDAELAQAHVDIRRRRAELDVRAKLFSRIKHDCADKFRLIHHLVDEGDVLVDKRPELLAQLCVAGCYIKRRCNLIIIESQHSQASTRELFWCLRESCDHLSEAGRRATVLSSGEAEASLRNLELAYDFFEELVEWAYPTLSALLVNLSVEADCLVLNLQLECAEDAFAAEGIVRTRRRAERLGAKVETQVDGHSWCVELTMPLGRCLSCQSCPH
ncbi:histidine kinase N-terminal 7TM domain-containing protein [uncultured Olegusella sp.]|uniref:histidine kinase N-terminal 7TM domain-containing protein n=1 Tax=uncultured Olegusella sp. TaxID=1979846 RepID=UPI00260E3955|nr:histidine kinase N-terminal 7TM domain-containing protein [uncultured Olegusella sp.]